MLCFLLVSYNNVYAWPNFSCFFSFLNKNKIDDNSVLEVVLPSDLEWTQDFVDWWMVLALDERVREEEAKTNEEIDGGQWGIKCSWVGDITPIETVTIELSLGMSLYLYYTKQTMVHYLVKLKN